MQTGIPLNDEDRWPWLDELGRSAALKAKDQPVVISCSALKKSYRQKLRGYLSDFFTVYIQGSKEDILDRMKKRNHFMPPSLLDNQLDTLEEPLEEEGPLLVYPAFQGIENLWEILSQIL
jgi:gluconokinase